MNALRLANVAAEFGVDAVVVSSPVDFFYVAGFSSISQRLAGGEALALVPAQADFPYFLIFPQSDLDLFVDGPAKGSPFATFGEFVVEHSGTSLGLEPPVDALVDCLLTTQPFPDPVEPLLRQIDELGLLAGRIAVQRSHMSSASLRKLEVGLCQAEVVDAQAIITAARSLKSGYELAALTKAARVAAVALEAAIERVAPGVTERELERTFALTVTDLGAEPCHIIIGSGQRSALTHSAPSGRVIERGDVVRFDVGGKYGGYHSDIARTVVVGEPSQRVRDCWESLVAGQDAAFAAIKPGVYATEVFTASVAAVRERFLPMYRRSHVGHAIGLELYEKPMLRPNELVALQENMVLNVEFPYYELGFAGMSIEEPVVVTHTGCRRLNPMPRELLVV